MIGHSVYWIEQDAGGQFITDNRRFLAHYKHKQVGMLLCREVLQLKCHIHATLHLGHNVMTSFGHIVVKYNDVIKTLHLDKKEMINHGHIVVRMQSHSNIALIHIAMTTNLFHVVMKIRHYYDVTFRSQ